MGQSLALLLLFKLFFMKVVILRCAGRFVESCISCWNRGWSFEFPMLDFWFCLLREFKSVAYIPFFFSFCGSGINWTVFTKSAGTFRILKWVTGVFLLLLVQFQFLVCCCFFPQVSYGFGLEIPGLISVLFLVRMHLKREESYMERKFISLVVLSVSSSQTWSWYFAPLYRQFAISWVEKMFFYAIGCIISSIVILLCKKERKRVCLMF